MSREERDEQTEKHDRNHVSYKQVIFDDGRPVKDDYTFLASTWATPTLEIDGDEEIECYIMSNETRWGSDTKWPNSSLEILNS